MNDVSLRTVAIVGRPNVGKSTLFNRIVGERRSVVHETAGVTRDRITETTDWAGHPFILLDTGGIIPFGETVSEFDAAVTEIARHAIEDADVVLFLVDAKVGPMAWDESIARDLRKRGKPVVLTVNKVEKDQDRAQVHEFHSLGLGEPHAISALHGRGVGDLLDEVVEGFPVHEVEMPCDCKVAILGRPNVGKSSPAEHPDRPRRGPGQRDPGHHPRLHPHRPELARPHHPPDRHRRPAPQVEGAGGHRGLQQHAHPALAGAVRRGGAGGRRRRRPGGPGRARSPA